MHAATEGAHGAVEGHHRYRSVGHRFHEQLFAGWRRWLLNQASLQGTVPGDAQTDRPRRISFRRQIARNTPDLRSPSRLAENWFASDRARKPGHDVPVKRSSVQTNP